MKGSLYSVLLAALALGAMLLPDTALAGKRTPFTSTETDTPTPGAGDWFTAGDYMYVFEGKSTLVEEASDSRVTGSGWYSAFAVVNMQAGAATFWGQFHIENAGGAWDGYWTGNERQDGLVATLRGSGKYEGLVSRWTSTAHGGGTVKWSGYIVENGPGDVPFKINGWRDELFEPIKFDGEGNPVFVKASLVAGGGKASHAGVFTDVTKVGLVNFADGRFSGTGTVKAPNGDLLNWVVLGTMAPGQPPAVEAFFAGGTGRFEHAVGYFAGPMIYQSPVSYTYEGTGTIRY